MQYIKLLIGWLLFVPWNTSAGFDDWVAVIPNDALLIKGGPTANECSSFKADRDMAVAVGKALSDSGVNVTNNVTGRNLNAMQLAVTGFSWDCQGDPLTVRMTLTASDIGASGWRRSFDGTNSVPSFSAMECWTISCANKKWEGVFYPMAEELAIKLAREAFAAYQLEIASKSSNPVLLPSKIAQTTPQSTANIDSKNTLPTSTNSNSGMDILLMKEKADKLYAKKKDKVAQKEAYDLYTQIASQSPTERMLKDVNARIKKLEKAGVTGI